MYILGINAYHGDSAAALVKDGVLIAAVEEERFNRVKHWAGFPADSIRYCLAHAGITAADLDHVAVSFNPSANLGKKIRFTLNNTPSFKSILDRLNRQSKGLGLRENLAKALGCTATELRAEIHNVEHHASHVGTAFLVSPYERSAILSIDGMGDFVSLLTASGDGREVKPLDRVFYPHSLGFLYNAITLYLGFPAYGDEYKVMGLAPYGEPEFLDLFRKIVRPKGDTFELNLDYFTHPAKGISMSWENGSPTVDPFYSDKLTKELGPARDPKEPVTQRHQNIAISLQRVTEEIIFHVLNRLHKKCPLDNVCIGGGVAMNSVANGKITLNTPFKNAYIPVGAADNGTSFGAAFHVWNVVLEQPRNFVLEHGYWGPAFADAEIAAMLRRRGAAFEELSDDALLERAVDLICDGKVLGWFQGRMEFGARALGNRSLLADPRRADMKDIINLRIKFREKFRPFAPSILEERVGDFFELSEPSPFMEKVFQIRPEKRALIPAVTHVDGSGRLQSVKRSANDLYWRLIKRFEDRTGVPIVLNTSLNENEPIVHTPEQALNCFLRTKMDNIALGHCLVRRP